MAFHLHDPDLRLLRVFETIVRNKGFVGAQTELNIAASTLSNHLSALEHRLGATLCTRGRSGFKLTAKGLAVYAATLELFGAINAFERQSSGAELKMLETLRCGVLDAVASDENYRIHEGIDNFLRANEGIHIFVSQENPQTLQERLLNDELDVGIGSFLYKATGLTFTPLYTEHHSLYCSDRHPLFSSNDNDEMLKYARQSRVAGRTYWRESDRRKLGLAVEGAQASHIEAQLTLVLSGAYVGLLPDHVADHWVARRKLRKLLAEVISYECTFEIAIRSRKSIAAHTRQFVEQITEIYKGKSNGKSAGQGD